MKLTAVFAAVLSMAAFTIAAPVAAPAKGMFLTHPDLLEPVSNGIAEVVRADHGACVKSAGDGVMEPVNC